MEKKSSKSRKKSSNIFRLVVYLHNTERSKVFKTTHSFINVKTVDDAFNIIETFFTSNSKRVEGETVYNDINIAYYNGKLIVKEGRVL